MYSAYTTEDEWRVLDKKVRATCMQYVSGINSRFADAFVYAALIGLKFTTTWNSCAY